KAGQRRRERNLDVAKIVNVGQANCRIVAAWVSQQSGDAPVAQCGKKPDHDRHAAPYRRWVKNASCRLPKQQCAQDDDTNRVEDVGGPKEGAGKSEPKNRGEI